MLLLFPYVVTLPYIYSLAFYAGCFKCIEVLICEVLFGHLIDLPLHSSLCILLCFLLLNFVLGGLNSVEHGVDQVL